MDPFLSASDVIDHDHPAVRTLARELGLPGAGAHDAARRAFEHVRDAIPHTIDLGDGPVTCAASEVAIAGTGICFAKSHLLVALLRAGGLRAGLCYQRFADGDGFGLHGLAAVELAGIGWYRLDARGGAKGAAARFTPPEERLVFAPAAAGEWDSRAVLAEPLPSVVAALRGSRTLGELLAALPDVEAPPVPEPG